jgi:hypothetical protein
MVTSRFPLGRVFLAGLAGGFAEVIWVALYASFAPLDGSRVAHEVTSSFVVLPMGTVSVWLGVGVHMLLALAVAYGFAAVIWRPITRRHAPALTWVLGPAVLAAVWAMNFMVILPLLNPTFVTLMPHGVTLASKLLFGMGMAAVLMAGTAKAPVPNPSTQARV